MPTDLLARVRKLTTGVVEIDGGKLPGSDVSSGQVIRCVVVSGIIPMTDCSFFNRGKLGVQVESPWRQRTLYARPEDVINILNTVQPERQSARTAAAAAVAALAGRPKRAASTPALGTPAPAKVSILFITFRFHPVFISFRFQFMFSFIMLF